MKNDCDEALALIEQDAEVLLEAQDRASRQPALVQELPERSSRGHVLHHDQSFAVRVG